MDGREEEEPGSSAGAWRPRAPGPQQVTQGGAGGTVPAGISLSVKPPDDLLTCSLGCFAFLRVYWKFYHSYVLYFYVDWGCTQCQSVAQMPRKKEWVKWLGLGCVGLV